MTKLMTVFYNSVILKVILGNKQCSVHSTGCQLLLSSVALGVGGVGWRGMGWPAHYLFLLTLWNPHRSALTTDTARSFYNMSWLKC